MEMMLILWLSGSKKVMQCFSNLTHQRCLWRSSEFRFPFLLSRFWFSGPLEGWGCFPVTSHLQSIFGKHNWKVHNVCSIVLASTIVTVAPGRWGDEILEPEGMREIFQAVLTVGRRAGSPTLGPGPLGMQYRDLGSKPQIWTLLFLWT